MTGAPRKRRLLIDAIAYSPHDGGFTRAMRDLLDACASLEDLEIVVATHHTNQAELSKPWLKVIGLRYPRRSRFFASLLILPWLVRRLRIDAVHCEISALPRFLGVPGSVTAHDLYFLHDPQAGGSSPRRWVMQAYWERMFAGSLRRATVIKAVSQATAEDLTQRVGPGLPVEVIWPKIPLRDPKRRTWPEPGEPIRILTIGSVVPRRNLPFLLEALASVKSPWQLDIAGSLWWGAADLAVAARDKRVAVRGYVSDAALDQLYDAAHVLISASLFEGFGYPVADAMAAGLPVLTSNTGAFRDYVPESCRFDLDDPRHLAELLDGLTAEAWGDRRAACLAAVRRFSPEAHVAAHRRLFARLTLPRSVPDGDEAFPPWSERGPRGAEIRSRVRRVSRRALGQRGELMLHRFYHLILRRTGHFGVPESAQTQGLLAALVAPSRTILDIGANVGRYSEFLLRHAQAEARLWAFEPNVQALELLESNIGGHRIAVFPVGLGASDSSGWLHVPKDDRGNPVTALGWATAAAKTGSATSVNIRAVDSLVADGSIRIEVPVFVKIDVEGQELRVLEGARHLMRSARPVIYMECQRAHLQRAGVSERDVWDLLHAEGYRILGLVDGQLMTCGEIRDDVSNYFVIPVEATLPEPFTHGHAHPTD